MLMLDGSPLTLEQIESVACDRVPVSLSDSAIHAMERSRGVIERILERGDTVYGVNTGFGRLADVRIAPQELRALQMNLVRSHAVGVGEPLDVEETRAMMLLRANVLAKGVSGARPCVAEQIVAMLNAGIHPLVPSRGSVGASGDLAPLAHLALAMVGEGPCWEGSSSEVLPEAGIEPLTPEAKEGLALLNGTQAMTAVGCLTLARAKRALHAAETAGAMSLEALMGTPAAHDPRIHDLRPHPGQIESAHIQREMLEDSEIRESHRLDDPRVQDAYSLRCMPQVHGAVRGALAHVEDVLRVETGSGTDNPLVLGEDVVSGGNFHGAPIALALDYAAIAMTDLGSISERRTDRLVNPDTSEGLPPFLTRHPGTMSGFMMAQVTAAALLNECKVLAHPASVDNVPTSGAREDHVSMGMTAALKLKQIVALVERILAIEALAAAEGLEFRKPLAPGRGVAAARQRLRELVPSVAVDRPLGSEIELVGVSIQRGDWP
jgi:histidine ammonia-lyase